VNNRRAFEFAVQAYSDDLYRYAYWLCRHPKDAEDLVQECFYKAWRSWPELKEESAAKKWLFVILRREFLRKVGKSQLEFEDLDQLPEIPELRIGMEDIQTIRKLILDAPEHIRSPLILQVLGGFSCEEIAQLETSTVGAVMARLTRARKWFRSRLSVDTAKEVG
jgi:RNA polymerase sigma-70 factor (ECF subfamily)